MVLFTLFGYSYLPVGLCVISVCRINITEGGKNALLTLSGGDLRRVLNLLQSAHASYPEITEDIIYMTAGAALPSIINKMLNSLLNDSFNESYSMMLKVRFCGGSATFVDCVLYMYAFVYF